MVRYVTIQIDKETRDKLKELATEEGFQTVSSFLRYIAEVYPTLKKIKEMFDSGKLGV